MRHKLPDVPNAADLNASKSEGAVKSLVLEFDLGDIDIYEKNDWRKT